MTWMARARWAMWVVWTVVGSWGIASVRQQNHRIDETRADVLCPLYGVFLASDTPARRASLPPDELDQYEHAIEVLHAGAEILGCPRP